jgi:hypothetical protein
MSKDNLTTEDEQTPCSSPCSTSDQRGDMFEFCDFKNHMDFNTLGGAVRRMDKIIDDWRDKPNDHIGSLICLALGWTVSDLAELDRQKRIAASR